MKWTKLEQNILELWNYGYNPDKIEQHHQILLIKDYSMMYCSDCDEDMKWQEDGYFCWEKCGLFGTYQNQEKIIKKCTPKEYLVWETL